MQSTNKTNPTSHNISESQLLEVAQGYAMGEMRMKGQVLPTCFFLANNEIIIYRSTGFAGVVDKEDFIALSRLIAMAYNATAVALVVEAWTAGPDKGHPDSWPRPSEAPDRRECLVVNVEGRASTAWLMLLIKRDEGGAFIGVERELIPKNAEMCGRFVGVLQPKPTNKSARRTVKRLLRELGVVAKDYSRANYSRN
jgi:hypothetical protein